MIMLGRLTLTLGSPGRMLLGKSGNNKKIKNKNYAYLPCMAQVF